MFTFVPVAGLIIVATGGLLPTVTLTVAVLLRFVGSVTLNVAVKVRTPPCTYVCVGFACVDVVPSPKSQKYVSAPPSGSVDAAPLKFTVNGEYPEVGVAVALATGG